MINEFFEQGKGFFFELSPPPNTNPTDEKIRTLDGPQIKSKKLEFGGGSILFLKKGYVEMLEVFAYGDTFPEYLDEFELQEGNLQKFNTT